MATERKLRRVWFFPSIWDGQLFRDRDKDISYASYDEIPQRLRERAAVLRLLEEGEQTSLGMWKRDLSRMDHDYWIVRQPGDPPWGEW